MFTAKINNKEFAIKFKDNSGTSGIISDELFEIDIIKKTNKCFHILHNNISYNLNVLSVNKQEKIVSLKVNGNSYDVEIKDELDILLKSMGIKTQSKKKNKELKAPMPGLVTKILINKGDKIKKGDNILVLEAMKMENNLKATQDAIIKEIIIEKGNSVEKNQILVTFE